MHSFNQFHGTSIQVSIESEQFQAKEKRINEYVNSLPPKEREQIVSKEEINFLKASQIGRWISLNVNGASYDFYGRIQAVPDFDKKVRSLSLALGINIDKAKDGVILLINSNDNIHFELKGYIVSKSIDSDISSFFRSVNFNELSIKEVLQRIKKDFNERFICSYQSSVLRELFYRVFRDPLNEPASSMFLSFQFNDSQLLSLTGSSVLQPLVLEPESLSSTCLEEFKFHVAKHSNGNTFLVKGPIEAGENPSFIYR